MTAKLAKALRLVCGFNDDLRIKLPYDHRKATPAEDAISTEILSHLTDIYGLSIYDKLGTVPNPHPGKDVDDYLKLLRFASTEARKVCRGSDFDE